MSELIIPSRRGFLAGLVGVIAAPAVVSITNIMPVSAAFAAYRTRAQIVEDALAAIVEDVLAADVQYCENSLLTTEEIIRDGVRFIRNSNKFLLELDSQWNNAFSGQNAKIGTTLRIRLPQDYTIEAEHLLDV